jgi:hypothetical protein
MIIKCSAATPPEAVADGIVPPLTADSLIRRI